MNRAFARKVGALLLSAVLVLQIFTAPSVARAQLAVIDAANLAANTTTAANATTQTAILNVLNGIAWSVAKIAVQSITRSTVNWINSGFNGSPAFVSDLQSNLSNLSDAVADNFFAQLNKTVVSTTGFNINSPFQDQLNQQLRQEYYKTTSSFGLNYTLNQQSTNPSAFLKGDFNNGGFNAYLSTSQNPSNNPFGAYIVASNALWTQIDSAAQQRKAELEWGKGFLPWRGNCATTHTSAGDSMTSLDTISSDNVVSLNNAEKCRTNSVKTPGSVIESQLENNLGTGVRQLELADSVNEIVGALAGQLVNQVLGAGGLLGASQPSSGGGSSYINQSTNSSQYTTQATSLSSGVAQSIQNDIQNATDYRNDWQTILTAAQGAQQACGVRDNIPSTISQATAAIARATNAITAANRILAEVQAASQSTSANNISKITTAASDYQSYLSSSSLVSESDVSASSLQSVDTGTSTESPSLYSQMINEQRTCSTN